VTFVVGAVAALCLAMPAHLGIVAGFDDPCPFCAGSRSVIVATRSGNVVPAPVTGTVSYVGTVGGAPWIVVRSTEHPAVRVTLGGVGEVRVAAGDAVTIGEPIGTTATRLVVTLRDADTYRDPSPWLLPESVLPGSVLPGSVLPKLALPRSWGSDGAPIAWALPYITVRFPPRGRFGARNRNDNHEGATPWQL